ncbi:MAG TPA: response regulator [Candidatus Saccharimonadales bacterium]|nr:response regulator [Candidatus Saccharimonadales bacterium]
MADQIKIALIEDDAAIVNMYLTKLRHEGFNVLTAPDGLAGLELVVSFNPDVVLLDIMMPEFGGVEFLEKIRSKSANDNLKIIVMTNIDDPKLQASLKGMKISDYVVKAEITPAEMVDKIRVLTKPE